MQSIKKNVGWSSVLTTANYIFPLLTYPYVSRVLGVSNIGICNFVDSIVNYFCFFSMMGMSYLAIREVAKSKGDSKKLSIAFSSLLTLNLITTIIVIVVLTGAIFLVPRFNEHAELLFIGVLKVLFNSLLIEWLYKGLEEFRYVTIRSILVRLVYVASVFIFVREKNDYPIYYLLLTLTIVINAVINMLHSRKYVRFTIQMVSYASLANLIKPFIILGIYHLLTSLYKTFNIVYLGFEGGNEQVGYYTTATKLHGIILALFSAFTGVMMPRMASLVSEGRKTEFEILFKKSIIILFAFSVPIMCLCAIFSENIIRLISGIGYEGATPSMQIVMPLVFILGYEQILVYQILMPLKKDRSIFVNSIVGAIIGLCLNFLLVPYLHSIGSALVWLLSEIGVLISAQYFVNKYVSMMFPFKYLAKYAILYFPLFCTLFLLHQWKPLGSDISFILACLITLLYFITVELLIQKNDLILSLLSKIKK